jgi:hypothetical protein
LHFRVFGFPVRVDPMFFFIVLALGFSTHATVGGIVAWFAVVFVSILIHELGHAFAARAVGSEAIGIELQSMGGLTGVSTPAVRSPASSRSASAGRSVCRLRDSVRRVPVGAHPRRVDDALRATT